MSDACTQPVQQEVMSHPRDQDGGWAWVVMCACAVCVMVTSGMAILAGMFQKVFLEELEGEVVITSWVTAIFSSQLQLSGSVSGVMSNVCGFRTTIMAGGLLLTTGLLASSFCRDVFSLLLVFGLCSGLGLGLIYSAAIVRVNLSFVKFRPLATGIVMGAGGVGIMVMPPLCSSLLSSFSCWHTLTIMAAICAQLLVAGALLFPPPVGDCAPLHPGQEFERSQQKRERKNLPDVKISSENSLPLLECHSTKNNRCPEDSVQQVHANTDNNLIPRLNGSSKLRGSSEDIQQNCRQLTKLDAENVCRNNTQDIMPERERLLVCQPGREGSRSTTSLLKSVNSEDSHLATSIETTETANRQGRGGSITGLCRAGQKSSEEVHDQRLGAQLGCQNELNLAAGLYLDNRVTDLHGVDHKSSGKLHNHPRDIQLASLEQLNSVPTNLHIASKDNSEELHKQCLGIPITCPEELTSAPTNVYRMVDKSSEELHGHPQDAHLTSSEELNSTSTYSQKVSDDSSKKLQNQCLDTHLACPQEVNSIRVTSQGTSNESLEDLHSNPPKYLHRAVGENPEEVQNQRLETHLACRKANSTPTGRKVWNSTSTLHGTFPSKTHASNKAAWRQLMSVLRNPPVLVLCLQLFLANASMNTVLVHFAEFCVQHGTDFDTLAFGYSAHGLTLSLARVLVGVLAQDRHVDPLVVYMGSAFVTAVINLTMPFLAVTGPLQLCAMAGTGIYFGGSYALLSEITIHCTGVDTLSLAFGMEMISAGLGSLVAPPVAGWLVVITGSYGDAIFLAGCVNLLAAFVAMTMVKLRPVWKPQDPILSEYAIDNDVSPSGDETTTKQTDE